MDATARAIQGGDRMIDVVIPLLAGVLIGANVGFVIAGLFGGNHDEDLPD